ncbi:MAG: hypothetical protein WCI91_03685 [Candidatus Nomurabacteria bacterium]
MLDKHSFKVILAFTGVILLGLISLVYIDSMKGKTNATSASANLTK